MMLAARSTTTAMATMSVGPSVRRAAFTATATAPRGFATSSSSSSPAAPQPPMFESPPPQPTSRLDWESYLKLRKSRRLAGLLTAVPTTAFSAFGAGSYFLTQEIDPSQALFGIDPIYLYGLATISVTGLGYLIGPSIGTGLWSLLHRSQLQQMRVKDADFYEHIKRRRVDPSRSNMQNPIPDFYGEKISSLKEYRAWLRDCSVYKRKAAHGLKDDAPEGGV